MPRPSRQMHGRRALAAAAAAGLLISLFAPWYRESIVARGLTGLRTMTLTRSGWDAFSFTEGLVLVVAVVALVLMVAVPVGDGNTGDGEQRRRRLSGAIVAALGVIAFVVVLVRLSSAPGTTRHALEATIVAVHWGIFLALGSSAVLAVAGLRLVRVPGPDAARSPRGRRPAPRGGPDRPSRPGRTDRAARPSRSDRTPRPDRVRPSGARSDGRTPSPTPARRSERPRPARHTDRSRWEDQATGWLDLPD